MIRAWPEENYLVVDLGAQIQWYLMSCGHVCEIGHEAKRCCVCFGATGYDSCDLCILVDRV